MRSLSRRVLLGTIVLVCACDSILTDLEPDPDSIPPEEVLLLTRKAGAVPLPADGTTVDTFYAYLPREASSRVVTFETTAGSFMPLPGAKKLDVRAEPDVLDDDRLVAKAALRTDTVPTTAVVSAKVGEFIRYLPVAFIR